MARTDFPTDLPLTEADIQAFADGSLSPERAARVQRYLGDMPGEASRIAFYRRLNGQIQRAFDTAPAVRDEARFIEPNRGTPAVLRRAWRVLRGSMVQRIALLVLALAGWVAATMVPEDTLNAAALMSYAQVAESAAAQPHAGPAAPPAAQRDPFATEFAQLGWKLMAVKTRRVGLIAHATEFDYRNANGQPVVLLTAHAPLATERPHWMGHRVGEIRLLTWTTGGEHYVLAGNASTRGLMKAADAATFH
jgi:anti-sigma factor RsiW